MSAPAVSVILPVRNAMPYLPETLASLEAQSFTDFEVLVQDDGSTDDTRRVADRVAARDTRFRVASGPPQGNVEAANDAHARARAPLHVRIDGDDVATPDRIEKLVAFAMAHPEVGVTGSLVAYFPEDALTDGLRRYEAWVNGCVTHEEIVRDRYVELPIAQPSWAIRADVLARVGPYVHGPFPEDYEMFLRCVRAGVQFGKVPEVLHRYRDHPERTSRTDPRYGLDAFFELKARYLVPELERDGRPLAIAGAGRDGKRWARRLVEAGLDVRSFLEVHPGRIGQTIHGVRVLGYDDLAALDGALVLAAVGKPGGRASVRARLDAAGRVEGRDYVCVQ